MVGPDEFDRDDLLRRPGDRRRGRSSSARSATCSRSSRSYMAFFVDESCGYCTPCRVGNVLLQGAARAHPRRAGRAGGPRLPRGARRRPSRRPAAAASARPRPTRCSSTLQELPRRSTRRGSAQRQRTATSRPSTSAAGAGRAERARRPHVRPLRRRQEARHERPDLHAHDRRRRASRPSRGRPSSRRPTRPASTSRACATMKEPAPFGSCRVCTVRVNGRPQAACTQPVDAGHGGRERHRGAAARMRRDLIEMLFVEGNHFCMFCEKSGNCELQALAYRFGITAPTLSRTCSRSRELDASHPGHLASTATAASSARAASAPRASSTARRVFGFVGRGTAQAASRSNAADGSPAPTPPSTDRAVDGLPGRRDPPQARRLTPCRSAGGASTTSPSARRSSAPRGQGK